MDNDNKFILYPVGRYIAMKNILDQEIQFIPFPPIIEDLKCMVLSPDQKTLAISYTTKQESIPHLTIYSLAKKKEKEKTFRHHDTKSKYFHTMQFSHDSKLICLVTNEPDYQMLYLDFHKMKIIGSLNINKPISRISINPKESHYVAASGNPLNLGENILRLYKIRENSVYV